VALTDGINANIVHCWLREPTPSALVPQSQANAFVPVTLDEPAPSRAPHAELHIRVEVQRANATIVVKWPLQGGAACATWLREWLR
jgi:transposase